MTLTIAMSYWDCADLVERAVRSVLAQSHTDLRLVVVGDGQEPPLASIRDDRLEVYTLPENRGTYFAHALVLGANPDEWHAIVDSDDWVEPDHIERMLALKKTAVASGVMFRHDLRLKSTYQGAWSSPLGSHCGLFAVDRLRRIGGYDPSTRLAQDTLVLKLLYYTGGYFKTLRPTYHRVKRAGALTTAPDTGLYTPLRRATWGRYKAILETCRTYLPDIAAIRAYRESLVPEPVKDDLAFHVDRLRARLGPAQAVGAA